MSADRLAVGCMTGTSMDGLDAVLVRCRGEGVGLAFVEVVGVRTAPLPARRTLREIESGKPVSARAIAEAARALGEAHAETIAALLEDHGMRPELVAVHGQTVHHKPPTSWQLINPWAIAQRVRAPVVYDLRGADLAAGGEGAPITPMADWVMFRDADRTRAIVNLGGFVNATVLPSDAGPESVRGFDVCACNRVLDAAARIVLDREYDEDGRAAMSGTVDGRAGGDLRERLEAQAAGGRSLGTGDEAVEWVAAWAGRVAPADLVATAARTIGSVVGVRVRAAAGRDAELYLAGGGAHNAALADAIGGARPLDDLGVRAGEREAAAMAVLGLLAADGVAVTLPGVTGRRDETLLTGACLTGAWINANVRTR